MPKSPDPHVIPAPKNAHDLNGLLLELGKVERMITQDNVWRDEQIAQITDNHNRAQQPSLARREALLKVIGDYAQANREKLTGGKGRKSCKLHHGTLQWRESAGALEIVGTEDDLVAELKRKRGGRPYIRTKETVKKQKLKEAGAAFLAKLSHAKLVFSETLTIVINPTKPEEKPLKIVHKLD